ncbi:MAG: BrnA antitoxin family protein [Rhodobacteraceae bacterium]|nr:BrnA antitoxin family protein [Paracoccaceae bacterium]
MALVKFTLDMENPPETPQEYLDRFDAIREEDIDYSDIPEMDDEFWKHAKIVPNPLKPVVTMRLEPETVAFFKGDNPKGYTGRMAAVLKAYVKAQRAG